MLVRIVRNLTAEAIRMRIEKFENVFGMPFEEVEELFIEKRLDAKSVSAYFSGVNSWTAIKAMLKAES